jgi:oxygen-independent coproporphyrinogen-3 oxidase
MTMTQEERLIREFVLQTKLGRCNKRYFEEKFGVDVVERWKPILSGYEEKGYLHLTPGGFELTRDGLLEVDRLLHAFFQPQHREIRYT